MKKKTGIILAILLLIGVALLGGYAVGNKKAEDKAHAESISRKESMLNSKSAKLNSEKKTKASTKSETDTSESSEINKDASTTNNLTIDDIEKTPEYLTRAALYYGINNADIAGWKNIKQKGTSEAFTVHSDIDSSDMQNSTISLDDYASGGETMFNYSPTFSDDIGKNNILFGFENMGSQTRGPEVTLSQIVEYVNENGGKPTLDQMQVTENIARDQGDGEDVDDDN